jgi:type VI secretion system Hcp family effector
VAGELDAFLTFGDGMFGKGQSRILNIYGETKDVFENDFGSIQIKSYEMGFSHDATETEEWQPGEGDAVAHDPTFEPVQIAKTVDLSTPYLLQAVYVGAVFDFVWIWQKKAGAARDRSGDYFFKIELKNVTLTNLTWNASDAGSPQETLKLQYRGIKLEYLPQLATGALDKSQKATTKNPITGTDMLELPTAKNKKGKDGGASVSSAQVGDIAKQVTDMLKRNNPGLKLR